MDLVWTWYGLGIAAISQVFALSGSKNIVYFWYSIIFGFLCL